MTRMAKGAVVLLVQLALVCGVAAKAKWQETTLPRVWAKTLPNDPYFPIRGRYVSLVLAVDCADIGAGPATRARLEVRDGRLVARQTAVDERTAVYVANGPRGCQMTRPIPFFIPDKAPDPSRRQPGEEVWAEVLVPPGGPPRPVRIGVKRGDGPIEPLVFR